MNTTEPEFEPTGGPDVTQPEATQSSTSDELESLKQKIHTLEKQAGDYKLLIADFENSRKRLAQDAERQRKYQAEPLMKDLLSALDNLDYALKAAEQMGESGQLVKGVTATMQQFLDVLKRHGVHRMELAPGAAFDPNLHQAVMEQPTNDFAPGAIVSIMQMGFLFHDRVLRPASVITAVQPPAGGSEEN